MINWGRVPAGVTLPFYFSSYDGATGASEAITGLAITDVEIYKGVSMTQRSSDAGVVLLDTGGTDGISVDGIVGINGFSIDLSDNTDSGFYAAGSFYTVVVASVTADGQTVNFIAGTFWIDSEIAAIKAKTDNLPSDPADQSLIIAATDALVALIDALPTAVENADALLGRNHEGGANGGRTVTMLAQLLLNKVEINPSTGDGTVYESDDVTPAWTFSATLGARLPITSITPD